MQVVEAGFGSALCRYEDEMRRIDTMLVGAVEPGDWLLVYIDAAREIIDEKTALQIRDALQALDLVMEGETEVDHLFADLTGAGTPVGGERPLPEKQSGD